jgi:methionine-rich copper-binding protein CopC
VRRAVLVAAAAAALAVPAAAWAHAALLRTVPAASVTVNAPPKTLSLVYSEPVEPKFAIVLVSDANGTSQTAGPPTRSATNPDELDIPLRHLPEGWYLVFWRAISVDGHPVRGAFTFAVGPNPGPPPQFVIPSLSETAATPRLSSRAGSSFLSMMRRSASSSCGSRSRARSSARASGTRVTRVSSPSDRARPSRSSRSRLRPARDLAVRAASGHVRSATSCRCCASPRSAAGSSTSSSASRSSRSRRDRALARPARAVAAARSRSCSRSPGALAAAAALLVPGSPATPAQTSPRGARALFDWLHLARAPSGSAG